jgi:hypothetical protein
MSLPTESDHVTKWSFVDPTNRRFGEHHASDFELGLYLVCMHLVRRAGKGRLVHLTAHKLPVIENQATRHLRESEP